MSAAPRKKPILFQLAAEGVVPVIGGCAGALAGGVEGGLAGVAVARVVEKAINHFGRGIVERWQAWFAQHSPEQQAEALSELVTLTPAEAREQARELLLDLAPDAIAADLDLALVYLSAIPGAVSRVLITDAHTGKKSLPATVTFDDAESLIRLLPVDLPPYPVPTDLFETPYRLEELLGTGGFGAVYRASAKTLQHLPLAIKFCLDRGLLAGLHKERANLERLMKAANDRGAEHVVRLYGYDLDHATPYLVYEFVAGGDLTRHVRGRRPTADEAFDLIRQTAEGLAFAHRHGLVHRDVKPANVLVRDGVLKLADFGLGGVAVVRAVQRSRIGLSTIDYLSLAEQASLFRGAGTPLYMSPEQRRGANPDPRHDLYSLGVMWFQLLIGDVARELHPGWAKELKVRYAVPQAQIELIERCVGWYEERPKDAGELLALMAGASPLTEEGQSEGEELPDPGSLPSPLGRDQCETRPSAPAVTPLAPFRRVLRKQALENRLWGLTASLWEIRSSANLFGLLVLAALGLLVWLIGLVAIVAIFEWGVSHAVAGALAVVIVVAVVWQSRRRKTQRLEFREETIEAIRKEFPVEFAAWEGPVSLRNLDLVTHLRESVVSQPSFEVSDAPLAADLAEPTPPTIPAMKMRWRWAVAFAVPLAIAAGVFFAIRYEEYKKPFQQFVARRGTADMRYVLSDGTYTDINGYTKTVQWNETIARTLGVGVGVAVFAGALFGFRWPMRFPRATIASAIAGFVFPGLLLGSGVYSLYLDYSKVFQNKDGYVTRDSWGRDIGDGKVFFELYHRTVELQSYLLGAIPALVSAVGVMVLVRWVLLRRARRATTWEGEAPAEPNEPGSAGASPSQEEIAPPVAALADSSGLRSSLLVAKAKALADTYDALHIANRQPVFPWVWGGLLFGLLVGWLAGEASHHEYYPSERFPTAFSGTFDWYHVFVGTAVGVLAWLATLIVGWVWRAIRRNSALARLSVPIVDLYSEFPGHVAAWGGRTVLGTEDTALAICRAVARGDDPAAVRPHTLAQVHADADAKGRLTHRLSAYSQEQEKSKQAKDFALKLFVGVAFTSPVLGLLGGTAAGAVFLGLLEPRVANSLVVVMGVLVGLGVMVSAIWLVKRLYDLVHSDAKRRLAGLATDLDREFAPALRTLNVDLDNTVTVAAALRTLGGANGR